MKYAVASRLGIPAGGVTAGIDWASAGHAVCIVDAVGDVVSRFSAGHTAVGLRHLVRRLAGAGVTEAAIGRFSGTSRSPTIRKQVKDAPSISPGAGDEEAILRHYGLTYEPGAWP